MDLADSADVGDTLKINLLIGSDVWWSLGTGKVIRGRSRPLAIQTKVGWVLSGLVDQSQMSVNLTFTTTHSLRIDTYPTVVKAWSDPRVPEGQENYAH